MAAQAYNRAGVLLSTRPWLTHAFQVLLLYNTYTFNKDHDFIADVVANEASGTGYARLTVSGKTITIDDTNDRWVLDCDDFAYSAINTGATPIVGYVIAANGGNDATDEVIFYNDEGGFPKTLGGSDFNIVHNATEGIGYFNSP